MEGMNGVDVAPDDGNNSKGVAVSSRIGRNGVGVGVASVPTVTSTICVGVGCGSVALPQPAAEPQAVRRRSKTKERYFISMDNSLVNIVVSRDHGMPGVSVGISIHRSGTMTVQVGEGV